jgi:hypothetical protein
MIGRGKKLGRSRFEASLLTSFIQKAGCWINRGHGEFDD